MNGIEIDITITMGETCSNTMSLAEAKMLYDSLGGLFNGGQTVSVPVQTNGVDISPHARTSGSGYQTRSEVAEPTAPIAQSNFAKEPVTKPSQKPTMPPPNLKVEAARERAAKRTRNCGSR